MTREPKYVCPQGHVVKHTCKELTIEPLHWFCKDCRSTYTDNDVTPKSKVLTQHALIEQQAGVIQRQWDYIAQLKQTISVHEQAGLEGLVRDYNDHQRIEQQTKDIQRLQGEELVSKSMIDGLIKQVAQAQHDRDYYKRELGNTQTKGIL